MAAASSSPQAPPGGTSASAHGLPAPRPRPALMLPPASVLGGQGGAPEPTEEGDSEGGERGQWFGIHRPPEQTGQEKEVSGGARERQQAVSHQETSAAPPALPTCLLMSALHRGWGTGQPWSLCWPQRSETGPKNLPSSAGRKPGPSTTSPSAPVPGKPSPHIARPFQQPAASTPALITRCPGYCNAFFGGNVYSVSLPNLWLSCLLTC